MITVSDNHRNLIGIDLNRNDNGSYSSNRYGYFPNWSTVDRIFSGESEEIARKEGPTRDSTLYRNKKTGEYFAVYWAQ